ncbi:hypothetical protein HNY73_021614 [Argiope bruennichi]|uniref:Uncharacterized protein n=1 Tax=Argiope bruennichi TaxID=94029 RepID=A0A8T0E037_ARGBR|nr:hypothetical protein HNY73_021614 [Argiope bruennichi]
MEYYDFRNGAIAWSLLACEDTVIQTKREVGWSQFKTLSFQPTRLLSRGPKRLTSHGLVTSGRIWLVGWSLPVTSQLIEESQGE